MMCFSLVTVDNTYNHVIFIIIVTIFYIPYNIYIYICIYDMYTWPYIYIYTYTSQMWLRDNIFIWN